MASGGKFTRRRLRLWKDNPHCYWCGIETVLADGERPLPPDAATLDHIRSRFVPERAQKDGKWRQGIIVLACNECNHERGRMEQLFLAMEKPEVLHALSGSKPADRDFLRLQSKVATAAVAYVRKGRILSGCRQGQALRILARQLLREYERRNESEEPPHA